MNKIVDAFWEKLLVLPTLPKNAEVPWVPESFQDGASGSRTACHEDLGEDGAFHVCSCLKVISLTPVFKSFADSVVPDCVRTLS